MNVWIWNLLDTKISLCQDFLETHRSWCPTNRQTATQIGWTTRFLGVLLTHRLGHTKIRLRPIFLGHTWTPRSLGAEICWRPTVLGVLLTDRRPPRFDRHQDFLVSLRTNCDHTIQWILYDSTPTTNLSWYYILHIHIFVRRTQIWQIIFCIYTRCS